MTRASLLQQRCGDTAPRAGERRPAFTSGKMQQRLVQEGLPRAPRTVDEEDARTVCADLGMFDKCMYTCADCAIWGVP